MPDESARTRELLAIGSEIAGGAVGGALGFLAAGPAGAAGAGALGVVIAKGANALLSDLANRQLSHREEIRVGAAAAFALEGIRKRLEEGQEPRGDGFFSQSAQGRPPAEEILEGVLQKSKNEYQEAKIRFLGNFYANLAFLPQISPSEANHLLRIAESLSYRQMFVLALLFHKPDMGDSLHLRTTDYHGLDRYPYDMISLLQEILDMASYGLLALRDPGGARYIQMLGWSDVVPDELELTAMGQHLATLLGIGQDTDLPSDLDTWVWVVEWLREPRESGDASDASE